MEKTKFRITTKNGLEEVQGLRSKNFGIHKSGTYVTIYTVTHLPTGLHVHTFDYLKQAREAVKRFESGTWPVAWEDITARNQEDARENSNLAWEIIHEIEEVKS